MLTIESGPSIYGPSPISQPSEWIIYNDGLRIVLPQNDTYIIRVEGTNLDGASLVVGGVTFVTDSSSSYTNVSWNASQSDFLSTLNLANAIRSNAAYRSYTVRTARPEDGQPWRVIVVAIEAIDFTPDQDDNQAIPGVSIEHIKGAAEVRTEERLWYQFWGQGGPVSSERFAPFDGTGRVKIDGAKVAAKVLGASAPDPDITNAVIDPLASAKISVKIGTYLNDSECLPSFGPVLETTPVPFVNAVLQFDEVNGFDPFSPDRAAGDLLKWMTRRSNNRTINRYGYEWTSIYLGVSPWSGSVATRRLRKELFTDAGDSLGVIIEPLSNEGVLRVPTGYQNAVPEGSGSVAYYTIVIQFDLAIEFWVDESETLTLTIADLECREAEVYYLEGRGSWGTMQWDKLEQRTIAVAAGSYERGIKYTRDSLSPSGSVLFDEGGTYQSINGSAATFTLTSFFIKAKGRKMIEEMLESPLAYILSEDENGRPITRRIVFSREESITENREGGAKVSVSFTYSTGRRTR